MRPGRIRPGVEAAQAASTPAPRKWQLSEDAAAAEAEYSVETPAIRAVGSSDVQAGGVIHQRGAQRLEKAEIPDRHRIRPFHDARHAALTHLALTPEASELALMATAGHRSFATTRRYLHLAGRAFPQAAAAREDRLLAGELCTEPSTNLSAPEPISDALVGAAETA